MKKYLKIAVLAGVVSWPLMMSQSRADTYLWTPSGTFYYNAITVNWPDTDSYWYNVNGHSFYLSGIPGEMNNVYQDTAIIPYTETYVYPTITGTTQVVISNLIVNGGTLTGSNYGTTNTNFVINNYSTLTTTGSSSFIGSVGYSVLDVNTWIPHGVGAQVTLNRAVWDNSGKLVIAGRNLRTGGIGNFTNYDTNGILNITNGSVMRNGQEVQILHGGRINLSGSSQLIINSALNMSGTVVDYSSDYTSTGDTVYARSAAVSGFLYLDGQSSLTSQSATISYVGGTSYNLYVSGSSTWQNKGDLHLGNLDDSGGGVYIGSDSRNGDVADTFINSGLLNAASGANSTAQLGMFAGYAEIRGGGTNQMASGDNSLSWVGVSNHSTLKFSGAIDGATGANSTADIDVLDSSLVSAGNVRLASGVSSTTYLGADRGSQVNLGTLDMNSGVSSSGTVIISRTSSLTTKDTTLASGDGSETSVIVERNSKWTVNGNLSFASVGSGSLRVDNSELVVNGNMDVAKNAGSAGTLDVTSRGRLTVKGTLAYGDGDYPNLELNNSVNLGALTSTKELNVNINGNTTIQGKNDYLGSTTIAFRAVATLNDKDAQFGRAGSAGVTNLGSIRFGNGVDQSTLTINGDYLGVATNGVNPTIYLSANMNGVSPIVDRINITGNANGPTVLHIKATGKSGGPLDNDKIITIGGASNATFTLSGGAFYSGLYQYNLTTDGQDWFLTGLPSMAVANAILSTAGAQTVSWFAQMSNLNKRLGEVRHQEGQSLQDYILYGKRTGDLGVDFWVKTYGQQSNIRLGISDLPKFTQYVYGIDVGADKALRLDNHNTLLLGYYLGYGGNRHDFKRNGDGEADNYYTGFYSTWLNSAGWYADFIVKGQYTNNSFDATNADDANFRDHGSYHNWSGGASLEAGKRFDFKNGFFVEPSVQVSYLRIFNNAYATEVATVDMTDADILRFWGGARAGWNVRLQKDGPMALQPYLRIGATEQISSGNKVRIGGGEDTWRVNTDGLHGVGGFGLAFQITDVDQVHLDYEAMFGDKYDVPWNINLGYRHQF